MKRSILRIAIPLLMGICGNNAAQAAHDGTVNVLGKIIDNTCAVAADSTNLTVTLGNVASKQFTKAGDGSGFQPFVIKLEKCSAGVQSITVHFEGTADSENTQLLALTSGTGAATGVGVGIYNSDQSLIPFGDESTKFTPVAGQTTAALNFYARYIANGSTVTPGTANASATFVLTYA